MADPFRLRIGVRDYELDANGHVAGTVQLQYAQHARWECLREAGVDYERLGATGIRPVSLEERIRFFTELRGAEEVDVSCTFRWGDGKTFEVEQEIRRPDGELVAEVANVGGLLELSSRRLLANSAAHWRSACTTPSLIGL